MEWEVQVKETSRVFFGRNATKIDPEIISGNVISSETRTGLCFFVMSIQKSSQDRPSSLGLFTHQINVEDFPHLSLKKWIG